MKIIHYILLFAGSTLNVWGQEMVQNPDTTAQTEIALEEVTISASRENKKLRELPASVSVLPSSFLQTNSIHTLNNASGLIPNLFMPDYGSKLTSPIYIRGFGSRINSPSVGMYVDNVPYFEKSAFEFDFFDIERIEVLRGPQGTLFGKNSMGGLINIVSKSPDTHQGNHIFASAANYGSFKANAGHYNKLNDRFAYSLSLNAVHNNGYYHNNFLKSKVDELNSYGIRNKLIYKVSNFIKLENIFSFENSKQGGYPYALYNPETRTDQGVNYNQKSSYDRTLISDAFKIKYVSQNWESNLNVAFQFLDDDQKIDQDFTQDSIFFAGQLQKQNTLSGELTFQSKGDKEISWLTGVFMYSQNSNWDVDVNSYVQKLWYLKSYGSDALGMALFGQVTFKISNHLDLIGGIRFDRETSGLDYRYKSIRAGIAAPVLDTTYTELTDNAILPKIAINYHYNNYIIYASYTSGYKPGGFNSTFERPEHLKFKKETSFNYEIGLKSSLSEKLIYYDIALFYSTLKNQQITRTAPSGRGTYLDNSGLSENFGYELTLKTRNFKGFELMAAYGYTESKIIEHVLDTLVNYNGKYTPYIPKNTFAFQLSHLAKFKPNAPFDYIKTNVLFQQNGELYWDLANKYHQSAYSLLGATISLIKRNIQVDFFGKNLLNTKYHAFLFQASGKVYVQNSRPMQLGINVSFKF